MENGIIMFELMRNDEFIIIDRVSHLEVEINHADIS